MKKVMYAMVILLCFGCANNNSKTIKMEDSRAFEITEEASTSYLSEADAYSILIQQKLQEYLDKKTLLKTNPDFNTETEEYKLISIKNNPNIKRIELISPFEIVSDSIKKVVTKVVLEHQTDTIITFIKTSTIVIDNKTYKTHKIAFKKTEDIGN
ncbi:hypothetical protein ACSTS3_00440 [Aquimarina muelleri]|uniref:hypothetical protein n=1 Tax=Aquimarina muelleri TaxID=279356 RepID=UPI003F682F09